MIIKKIFYIFKKHRSDSEKPNNTLPEEKDKGKEVSNSDITKSKMKDIFS